MRISINWIKRLLGVADLGLSASELQARLSARVAEIESGLETTGAALDGVVAGRILTCQPHPAADKLRITTVDIGEAVPLRIVCGAPNAAAGQMVAVATVGATVHVTGRDGTRGPLVIKPVTLRGEASEGMICAEDELDLGPSHDGIMVLDGNVRPGLPVREALGVGDTVLVIENHAITHRPDLWGQLGWAREVAAILQLPPPAEPDIRLHPLGSAWSAELADEGCSAYVGARIEGVRDGSSPTWMQALLTSAGVRPLGLLVDVTNLVMLELGEPMHAFDAIAIAGESLIVRRARDKEVLTSLDGRELVLAEGDLVIADRNRALALAGIMGGIGSMVQPQTTTVLLEAAIFRPERIRRTRKRLGIATDSSARFEKGLYPELAPAAINRAIALITELCPGSRVTACFAAGATAGQERRIAFAQDQVGRTTGLEIPWPRQVALLGQLGFTLSGGAVRVPWWRAKDVVVPADLVEEVARSHGYEHIVPETPRLPAAAPASNPLRAAEHRCRRLMSGLGWDEVATYAFTSQAWVDLLALETIPIHLAHALSSEQNVMRPSLVPNLLQAVSANLKHQRQVALYEIGKRYGRGIGRASTQGDEHEEVVICGAVAGSADAAPFYAARDAALALLEGLGYPASAQPPPIREPSGTSWQTPTRTVRLVPGGLGRKQPAGAALGWCTELPKALRDHAGCTARVGYFEIALEQLLATSPQPLPYRAPSRFPVVERQFTWDCPDELPFAELETPMRQAAGELYAGLALDSIYRGEQLSAGRKAVSLRIFLQAYDRTLDDKDLNHVQSRIIASIEKRTPARLRQ
jgi:phenylalanyl-tRNA synthetase beta chain